MNAPSLRSRIAIWLTLSALLWVGFALACFWLVQFSGQVVAMLPQGGVVMGERIFGNNAARELGLWPCGHPRTEENSQTIGKAGVRCKECRRQIARRWNRKHYGIVPANFKVVT